MKVGTTVCQKQFHFEILTLATLKLHLFIFFGLAISILPISAVAQSPERWEEIGPVDFTAIANQSPTTLVMPTTDGFLYVSTDFGVTWQHRYVDDTLSLLDVHFVDSLHGMLISWIGDVLFTSDGGVTWSRSNISNHPTRSAYLSRDTAIVCDNSGFVWRTTNRGNSWNSQRLFSHALYATYFTGSRTGFVCGDSGAFAKTNDAGATWTTQDIGAGDSIFLHCLDFYNGDTGMVGGYADGEFGHTFVTTDGGNTWLNRPMPASLIVSFNSIKMMTSTSLFAAGGENVAWTSTDLGLTWNTAPIGGGELINGTWYSPSHGALLIGSLGNIQYSTNEGENWQYRNVCYGETQEYMVNFQDTLMGVDLGSYGTTFIRSSDGGDTWGTYSLLNRFPWTGILFQNSSDGVALYGDDLPGFSVKTTDGGLTWASTIISDTFSFPYYNFYASSYQAAYAMYGRLGGVYTSNYGSTWERISPIPLDTISPFPNQKIAPSYCQLLNISAFDRTNAYAVIEYTDTVIGAGSGGNNPDYDFHYRIHETTNAGKTWEEFKNAPAFVKCYRVYFRDPSHGFLCCDSGVVFRTTDSGQSWIRDSICAYANNITSVGFLNDSLGFCGSHNAEIFRTTDGGITWQNDSLRIGNDGTSKNVNEYFDQFLFPDSNTVIATTREGFYRRKLTSSQPASVTLSFFQTINPLTIYPNPTTGILHLESTFNDITITDLLGRTWLHSTNGAHDLDVSGLPQGIYSISDGKSRAQFVKE